ncbi:MAG: tetratricopeptide repeat protein, partial [Bacteroidales bacterium]|nr:tetratricopeptide repeat protein [Bacteroidales bacterium]
DKRWVNGTLGRVHSATPDRLEIELEDGTRHVLTPEQWENIEYGYDEETHRVSEKVLGIYRQYPIRLAWALTIHKSQGLTFNRVIIDLGRGAFSSGQSYVALSRSTSLDGLTLKSPLTARDIFVNPAIVGFTRLFNNQDAINQAIEAARADEMYRQAAKKFDMGHTSQAVDLFFAAMQRKDILHRPEVIRLIKHKLAVIDSLRSEIKTLKSEAGEGATKFRQLAGEYITLGEECLEEGELSPAIANYRKALDIAPGDLRALHGLANAYTLSADLDSAVSTYLTILKQDSENATALIRLSDLYQQTGDTYEALNLLLKALAHDKKNPAIYNSIADIYDLLGDPDEAERYRHAAKTLRPPRRKKG